MPRRCPTRGSRFLNPLIVGAAMRSPRSSCRPTAYDCVVSMASRPRARRSLIPEPRQSRSDSDGTPHRVGAAVPSRARARGPRASPSHLLPEAREGLTCWHSAGTDQYAAETPPIGEGSPGSRRDRGSVEENQRLLVLDARTDRIGCPPGNELDDEMTHARPCSSFGPISRGETRTKLGAGDKAMGRTIDDVHQLTEPGPI